MIAPLLRSISLDSRVSVCRINTHSSVLALLVGPTVYARDPRSDRQHPQRAGAVRSRGCVTRLLTEDLTQTTARTLSLHHRRPSVWVGLVDH